MQSTFDIVVSTHRTENAELHVYVDTKTGRIMMVDAVVKGNCAGSANERLAAYCRRGRFCSFQTKPSKMARTCLR